ncbi:MAG: DUF4168 domain-containing protein [Acetobacteraceae bacterium]
MMKTRAAALAAALLLAGAVPALAEPTSPKAGAASLQDPMSETMIRKVGTALRHVATIREQYAQKAQAVNSDQQRQDLSAQAEKDMLKAVTDQGLTMEEYDQTMQAAKDNAVLRQRLASVAQSSD